MIHNPLKNRVDAILVVYVLNCNTKISENSDMAKSWATFCCSGTYK